MDRQALIEGLRNIIGEHLKGRGLELVDLICRHEGRDLILRVLADRPEGGITLAECAELNSGIGRLLDEKEVLQVRYILEVSSPGLDRPLKTKSDFLRCVGKNVRFFLNEPIDGKIELEGKVIKADDGYVSVESKGIAIDIPLTKINRGKQII